MTENESDQSWYDITLEEELEREKKNSLSSVINGSSNSLFSHESRRSFPVLSPLKEADRSLEMKEEMLPNDHVLIKEEVTPKKTRLGPRASQRHSLIDELSPSNESSMTTGVTPSPGRRVKLEMVDASPVSRNVKSRLGPRASRRHATPEQTGNKRHLVRDSPLRDTDHKDKRHRMGTPTRDKTNPTSDKHIFSTPEPIKNSKKSRGGKFKTPNSDSRLYTKKNQTNKDHFTGTGKDLFGNTRKRGNSESHMNKENDEQQKALTEEQIAKREKQVMYGKVTDGYQNYKSIVPKSMRNIRDPATPKKDHPYSKRCWDGLVRSWRRKLHEWDEPNVALNLRGAYTKNNKDLKDNGLINESGEVVMFSTSEPADGPEPVTDSQEEEIVPPPAEPITWDIPNFAYPDEDDTKSQDSEYTRLLDNKDDFPEDDSDDSYHLSQDSQLSLDQSQEDDLMDCEDESVMQLGSEPFNHTSVC